MLVQCQTRRAGKRPRRGQSPPGPAGTHQGPAPHRARPRGHRRVWPAGSAHAPGHGPRPHSRRVLAAGDLVRSRNRCSGPGRRLGAVADSGQARTRRSVPGRQGVTTADPGAAQECCPGRRTPVAANHGPAPSLAPAAADPDSARGRQSRSGRRTRAAPRWYCAASQRPAAGSPCHPASRPGAPRASRRLAAAAGDRPSQARTRTPCLLDPGGQVGAPRHRGDQAQPHASGDRCRGVLDRAWRPLAEKPIGPSWHRFAGARRCRDQSGRRRSGRCQCDRRQYACRQPGRRHQPGRRRQPGHNRHGRHHASPHQPSPHQPSHSRHGLHQTRRRHRSGRCRHGRCWHGRGAGLGRCERIPTAPAPNPRPLGIRAAPIAA